MKTVINVDKYEISHENGLNFKALRNGQEWRDLTGDKLILSLCLRIEYLEKENSRLEEELYSSQNEFEYQ